MKSYKVLGLSKGFNPIIGAGLKPIILKSLEADENVALDVTQLGENGIKFISEDFELRAALKDGGLQFVLPQEWEVLTGSPDEAIEYLRLIERQTSK